MKKQESRSNTRPSGKTAQPAALVKRAEKLVFDMESALMLEAIKRPSEDELIAYSEKFTTVHETIAEALEQGDRAFMDALISHIGGMEGEAVQTIFKIVEESASQYPACSVFIRNGFDQAKQAVIDGQGSLFMIPVVMHTDGGLDARNGRIPANAAFLSLIKRFYQTSRVDETVKLYLLPYLYHSFEIPTHPVDTYRLSRNLHHHLFAGFKRPPERLGQTGWPQAKRLPGVETIELRFLVGMTLADSHLAIPFSGNALDPEHDTPWKKAFEPDLLSYLKTLLPVTQLHVGPPRALHVAMRMGLTGKANMECGLSLERALKKADVAVHGLHINVSPVNRELVIRCFSLLNGQAIIETKRQMLAFEASHFVAQDLIKMARNMGFVHTSFGGHPASIEPIEIEHNC